MIFEGERIAKTCVLVKGKKEIMKLFFAGLAILLSCIAPLSANAQSTDSLDVKEPVLSDLKQSIINKGRRPHRPIVNRHFETANDSLPTDTVTGRSAVAVSDTVAVTDSLIQKTDSVEAAIRQDLLKRMQDSLRNDSLMLADFGKMRVFNPDPNRALWMSLLFPGLGQVYNRRYWKLPIVVGGFVGLVYATSWNNRMHADYTKGYRDAMDSDPSTKSYMDFYPPTTKEENINMDWLKKALKSKKDYFRRNKELCVISMVGLYLLCAVDAYVDASLMHFDVSDDLSMKVKPAVIEPRYTDKKLPSLGVQCAVNF